MKSYEKSKTRQVLETITSIATILSFFVVIIGTSINYWQLRQSEVGINAPAAHIETTKPSVDSSSIKKGDIVVTASIPSTIKHAYIIYDIDLSDEKTRKVIPAKTNNANDSIPLKLQPTYINPFGAGKGGVTFKSDNSDIQVHLVDQAGCEQDVTVKNGVPGHCKAMAGIAYYQSIDDNKKYGIKKFIHIPLDVDTTIDLTVTPNFAK